MNLFQIRKADISDLENLAILFDEYRMFYERASDLAGARAFLRERFVHYESILFLAEDTTTKRAVGFTQLYPTFTSLSMAKAAILNDLYVQKEFRKQGVAKALLQTVATFGTKMGWKYVELSTAKTNVTAQSLYKSLGFVLDEEFLHLSLDL